MSLRLKLLQTACLMYFLAQAFAQSQLTEHRLFIPERGEVIGYLLSVDTNHYSFLPPHAWRVSSRPGTRSVVMMAPDLGTSVTVAFIPRPEGEEDLPVKESTSLILSRQSPTNSPVYSRARDLIATRYPDPIRETFVTLTGIGEGIGFDIYRKAGGGTKLASRVVYVVQDWGFVEFVLTAPPAKFAETSITFGTVINSFRRPAR